MKRKTYLVAVSQFLTFNTSSMRLILPLFTLFFIGCSFSLSAQTVVDFTTMANGTTTTTGDTYGQYAQKQVAGEGTATTADDVYAMWAGDTNGDGRIVYAGAGTDITAISTDVFLAPGNNPAFNAGYVYSSIYRLSDVDLNGNVVYAGAGTDITLISTNVFLHPMNSGIFNAGYVIEQQLPE